MELAEALAALDGDDPAPLHIYADLLTTEGDPRGEFIALQLAPTSPKNRRRQKALLEKHGKGWLGEAMSMLANVRWRWGFPHAATLSYALDRAPPELSTLRQLRLRRRDRKHNATQRALLLDPVFAGLTQVSGFLADETFQKWAEGERRPLTHCALPHSLQGRYDTWEDATEAVLHDAPGLAGLTSLSSSTHTHPSGWRRILETPLGRQIDRLEVLCTIPAFPAWLSSSPGLTLDLTLVSKHVHMVRTRRESLEITCSLGRIFDERRSITAARLIADLLGSQRPSSLGRIEISFPKAYRPTADDQQALDDAIQKVQRS